VSAKETASSFVIRPAQSQDAKLIRRRIWRERLDPTKLDWRKFVVAEAPDGAILGFAQMKDLGGGIREFGSLVVEPAHRGQGIGGALLRYFLERFPLPIYLMCGHHRVSYYRRFGFSVLQPSEMPTRLRWKWRVGTFFARLAGAQVAVMVYTGESNHEATDESNP
jgi:N-acetylglutamate synthase-like GNAT family acetyltransferase